MYNEADRATAAAAGFGIGGFFLGMLAGAVVGGIAALLLAPKSGPETREMITDRMNQWKDIVKSRAHEVGEAAKGMGQQGMRQQGM